MTRAEKLQVRREMGRAGGRRRTETLSPQQRQAIARKASLARWRRARSASSVGSAEDFARSFAWLAEHRKRYAGKWVALDGERLVAVGSTAVEVYQAARRAGVPIPFVEQVRAGEELPFAGW